MKAVALIALLLVGCAPKTTETVCEPGYDAFVRECFVRTPDLPRTCRHRAYELFCWEQPLPKK